jgi:hypothetical protein
MTHPSRIAVAAVIAAVVGMALAAGSALAQGNTITCQSPSQRYQYCRVDTHDSVRLVRSLSRDPCVEGLTWGYDRRGIWVDDGCRAVFEVGRRGDGGWDGDQGWERPPHRPGGDVPNWAVGTFRGYNPDYDAELTLRIHAGGKVVGQVRGRRIDGRFDPRAQEIVFPAARLRVERERRGIRLTRPGYRDSAFYARIR